MKKLLLVISILMAVTLSGCGNSTGDATQSGGNDSAKDSGDVSLTKKDAKACGILTEQVAKQFLNAALQPVQEAPAQSPTEDLVVTNCNYITQGDVTSLDQMKQAGLMIRAAQNSSGAADNDSGFKLQRLNTDQEVSGYGDDAFWSPSTGLFNILKNHNWYTITAGSVKPDVRTLEDAKKLADILIDKF
ncbi:MAG TPA: hypothetical protein PKX56_01965 [Marmoricola sp.]|nr:hypothetical protein [Marmoricola sp.]HNI70912.1 hypothetical protein [Marmoricola sp.]HNJ78093.1 hypothetical protein [Marmoricola sp.]HNO39286.1 hypothetical protein [Marmoricola sp.]